MTDTDPDIKAIFIEALDLATDAERAAYLDRACAGSPGVRARVEALLAAIGQAGSFLETPALAREAGREPRAAVDPATLAAGSDSVDAPVGVEATADHHGPLPITEGPGTRIGPSDLSAPSTPTRLGDFELVRRLGEGAMGVVFEARQVSLNRPVAVKMIRAGLFAGEADLRRFRIEAEAVAHLDHPRIVPIYDVGEHQDCHYFSMKLIRGGSLAQPPARVPRRPSRRGAAGGRGRPGDPARPRAGHPPPRPEAVQHPARRGGSAARDRLRPGEAVRRRQRPDAVGRDRGDAELHGPRAGRGRQGGGHGADRRLRPGGRALRPVDRPPPVRRGHDPRDDRAGARAAAGAAVAAQSPRRPRPGDDLPEVPGEGPAGGATPRPRRWPTTSGAGSTASRSRRGRSARRRGPGCGRAATRSSPACSRR